MSLIDCFLMIAGSVIAAFIGVIPFHISNTIDARKTAKECNCNQGRLPCTCKELNK